MAGENWHATRSFCWGGVLGVDSTKSRASSMSDSPPQKITQLLLAWRHGDQTALDQLMPLVYQELRRLAHRFMKEERPGRLLQSTALVNEAYLRLIDSSRVEWEG